MPNTHNLQWRRLFSKHSIHIQLSPRQEGHGEGRGVTKLFSLLWLVGGAREKHSEEVARDQVQTQGHSRMTH